MSYSHPFFIWKCYYVAGALEAIHVLRTPCLFRNTFCSHLLWQLVCGWYEKNWKVCLSEESHCSQGAHLFHRTSCSNFCLRKHLQPFNLTISQQQLQLLIKYIKFFRRAIVHICTCKCDFGNSCFLQRAALSK